LQNNKTIPLGNEYSFPAETPALGAYYKQVVSSDAVLSKLRKTKMNKHSRLTSNSFKLAVMALAICGAGSAMAANTATATSTGVVVTPISVAKSVDMSFGSIAGGATAGTVTLTPAGVVSVTGGALKAGGTPAAAKFDVSGSGTLTYAIDYTGTATALTSAGDSMPFVAISDTSASAKSSGTVATGTLAAGAQSIYVGGILTVGINQNAGTYTGNIAVAVNYN
jgi:hypothetical protein